MKALAFLMCLLGSSLAAPAPDSGSNEQAVINHANTALQLMELYRMLGHLQQQGFGAAPTGVQLPAVPVAPAAPAAPAPVNAQPQVLPQAPQQGFFFNPALFAPTGDGSDEEGAPQFRGFYPPYGYQPAQPAAPLNSDEAEEAEGAEAAETAAEPEPVGTAATVDATAVSEIAPVDVAIEVAVEPVIAAVVPSLIPEVPAVAVEIDATLVGPDAAAAAADAAAAAAAGAEQVLVADAPDAALPVQ